MWEADQPGRLPEIVFVVSVLVSVARCQPRYADARTGGGWVARQLGAARVVATAPQADAALMEVFRGVEIKVSSDRRHPRELDGDLIAPAAA